MSYKLLESNYIKLIMNFVEVNTINENKSDKNSLFSIFQFGFGVLEASALDKSLRKEDHRKLNDIKGLHGQDLACFLAELIITENMRAVYHNESRDETKNAWVTSITNDYKIKDFAGDLTLNELIVLVDTISQNCSGAEGYQNSLLKFILEHITLYKFRNKDHPIKPSLTPKLKSFRA